MDTDEKIIKYGKRLINRGAKNVLISLGIDGPILNTHKDVYRAYTVREEAINPVGAGDSMVAGFIMII
nr:PfkB family carbohydrate kinase [Haloplasma contractile]